MFGTIIIIVVVLFLLYLAWERFGTPKTARGGSRSDKRIARYKRDRERVVRQLRTSGGDRERTAALNAEKRRLDTLISEERGNTERDEWGGDDD